MLASSGTAARFDTLVRPKAVLQVLHRMFPFARGLYEDKVANFWCSISVEARHAADSSIHAHQHVAIAQRFQLRS